MKYNQKLYIESIREINDLKAIIKAKEEKIKILEYQIEFGEKVEVQEIIKHWEK